MFIYITDFFSKVQLLRKLLNFFFLISFHTYKNTTNNTSSYNRSFLFVFLSLNKFIQDKILLLLCSVYSY